MKKFLIVLFALALAFAGCQARRPANNLAAADAKPQESSTEVTLTPSSPQVAVENISIVCTTFPQYDWVTEILGSTPATVTLLSDNGIDLHNYQPSADDILAISNCDLFIYNGGESDAWVPDVLETASNRDMVVLNMLEVLGNFAVPEELIEGMEPEEHGHSEDEEEGHEEDEEAHTEPLDEHVWLSPLNAQLICSEIANKLSLAYPSNASVYNENVLSYNNKLSALHTAYGETLAPYNGSTIVVGDRFPFRYMVDEYRLNYYAAFSGCSAETEASFETIAFLAQKVDELGVGTVIVTESSDKKIAETVIATTQSKDQEIIVLNSMQSIGASDIEAGTKYLDIMTTNLSELERALS